jgi:DnaK suppressor protein
MVGKFSKKDLAEIGAILLQKKEEIEKRIEDLRAEDPFADPDHANDNAAVDTDVREQEGHERIEAQIKDLEEHFNNIKIALGKIKKGNYGYCERCQSPIDEKRLKIFPEARFCIDCEREMKVGV